MRNPEGLPQGGGRGGGGGQGGPLIRVTPSRGVGGGGSEDKRNPGWGYPQVHTPRGRGTGEGRTSVTLVRITRSTRRRWVREGSGVGSERAEEGKNDKS